MENTFGKFLKEKRQEKKLTQKELAKLLIISESAVSKWEKDVAHPDITLLPKLAEILGVTEHELITASIDRKSREEKVQAKKWRALSSSWTLFFYISYIVSLIPCFICNLAIDRTLSWFWIVLSALVLAYTFTNLPKFIKKYKLIFIPFSMYIALCILLAVCCVYTHGDWFWIASISVLFGLVVIFMPIYISKYKIFTRIKRYNDFVSIGIDFVILNVLFIVINNYTANNGFTTSPWYLTVALPISLVVYVVLNILLSVRFLKVNKLLKTSIILLLINVFVYIIPMNIKINNSYVQYEIDSLNIFKADFSNWSIEQTLERNIHCIIFLSILGLGLVFGVIGLIKQIKYKNTHNK